MRNKLLGAALAALAVATAVPSYDRRTGEGGLGQREYRRGSASSSFSVLCALTDGPVARFPCHGATPQFDVASSNDGWGVVVKGSTSQGMSSGTTYEVVTVDRPYRELALAFEVTDDQIGPSAEGSYASSGDTSTMRRRLALHFVDSAEYSSCASFLASPTGVSFCASRGVGPDNCIPATAGCVVMATGHPHAWADACASTCGLPPTPASTVHAQRRRHVVANWEFDGSDRAPEFGGQGAAAALEGWANATASEMEAEVYTRGGELRGIVEGTRANGSAPHFDSPRLNLAVNGKQHLVFRMLYSGPAKVGRALFRSSGAEPEADGGSGYVSGSGSANWATTGRPNATAVRWSAGSTGAPALVDGSPHTGWRAPVAHDAWVVLDLGGVFAVTELDLIVAFGPHAGGSDGSTSSGSESSGSAGNEAVKSVRLQVGPSPDSPSFQTVLSLTVPHPNATSANDTVYAANTNGTASDDDDDSESLTFADSFTNAPQYRRRAADAASASGYTPGDIHPRYTALHDLEATPHFVGPIEGSRHAGDSSSPGSSLAGALSYRGFSTRGRYFRLYVGDNWGGSGIEVREVKLRGPDDTIVSMDFAIVGDGAWRTVSLPFHTKFQGMLHQIRLHPAVQAPYVRGISNPNALRTEAYDGKGGSSIGGGSSSDSNGVYGSVGASETEILLGADGTNALRELDAPPPTKGNAFAFDWIRVVVAPTIMRVEGCQVNKYYESENLEAPTAGALTPSVTTTNDYLRSTTFTQATWASHFLPYASTYNCLPGQVVTIRGKHLGDAQSQPLVRIGGVPCDAVRVVVPEYELQCTLPVLPPPAPSLPSSGASGYGGYGGYGDSDENRLSRDAERGQWFGSGSSNSGGSWSARFGDGGDAASYSGSGAPSGGEGSGLWGVSPGTTLGGPWSRFGAPPGPPTWDSSAYGPGMEDHAGRRLRDVAVEVADGEMPQVASAAGLLSYQVPPPAPLVPTISNVAARALDVSWVPLGSLWDQLTVTGYAVRVRELGGSTAYERWVTVGNVTTTTVIGLLPDTLYDVAVAAVAENASSVEAWTSFDLYGRRPLMPGAQIGPLSVPTNATATLEHDFLFDRFSANLTVNSSQAGIGLRASLGPSGVVGGEGHYGMVLVGDANVENCNASVACCDRYNYTLGISSCAATAFTCSGAGSFDGLHFVDGVETHGWLGDNDQLGLGLGGAVPYSDPDLSTAAPKQIQRWDDVSSGAGAGGGDNGHLRNSLRPIMPCGPALRLTSSMARQVGAAWYARPQNVEEGFTTAFTFRVANPSLRCGQMDDAYTHCRSRGGDGLAFVIQGQSPRALGAGGAGLGYTGIANSVAVEFDTFYNAELLEAGENHVAVHSRGWRHANNANQSYALASSTQVSDLGRDVHTARIVYRPALDPSIIASGRFESSPHAAHFLTNADFPNGGLPDFGIGLGQLEVYVDDLASPLLVTPLDMTSLLKLHHGRAWVGFTASTGGDTWQTQDVLSWEWQSLRTSRRPFPSPEVNQGANAFACADPDVCVHP